MSSVPHWGRLKIAELGSNWVYLSERGNTIGLWRRNDGDVVVKGFADGEAYQRGLDILSRVNQLPIFPRLLATLDLETEDMGIQPAIASERFFAEWINAQMAGAIGVFTLLPTATKEKIASGLATRLGLLHAFGIARDRYGMQDEFFFNPENGDVRLYDEENYRIVDWGQKDLDTDYRLSLEESLRAAEYFPRRPPDVLMYQEDDSGRYSLPGDGRFIVTLGDIEGRRTVELARQHYVEVIDQESMCLNCIGRLGRRAGADMTRVRLTLGKWEESPRQADYVEAFYPVGGTDYENLRRAGGYIPRVYLYDFLVNKVRVGGIVYTVSEIEEVIREWEGLIKEDPNLELIASGYNTRPPVRGGYDLSAAGFAADVPRAYLFFRKRAEALHTTPPG